MKEFARRPNDSSSLNPTVDPLCRMDCGAISIFVVGCARNFLYSFDENRFAAAQRKPATCRLCRLLYIYRAQIPTCALHIFNLASGQKKSKCFACFPVVCFPARRYRNIEPAMSSYSFRYFGSGMSAPFHMLSNFNECRITGRVYVQQDAQEPQQQQRRRKQAGEAGAVSTTPSGDDGHRLVEREFLFPSAEHYWWAHFTKNAPDVSRLAVGGDLSTLEGGLRLLLGARAGEQKAKHWRKKNSVGIVAKMVAAANTTKKKNKSGAKIETVHRPRAHELGMELGLHPLEQYGPQGNIETLRAIWHKIQTEKFAQNPEHRRVLASTGEETLVEFVRMRPEGHMWGGQVRGGVRRPKGLIVGGGELVGRNFTGKCLMAVRASL